MHKFEGYFHCVNFIWSWKCLILIIFYFIKVNFLKSLNLQPYICNLDYNLFLFSLEDVVLIQRKQV